MNQIVQGMSVMLRSAARFRPLRVAARAVAASYCAGWLALSGSAAWLALSGSAAWAQTLPVPPVPPATPPAGDIAPVPNVYAQAPVVLAPQAPRFDVRLYRARPYEPGFGFAPGSRYQDSEERKPIQTPGISISVPLN